MGRFLFTRGFILPVTVVGIIPTLIAWFTAAPRDLTWFSGALGPMIFGAGFALLAVTTRLFDGAGGSLAPWNPPRTFVAAGPYLYLRNPMILGIFLMLLGEAVTLLSPWLLLWFTIFVTGQQVYIRIDEEPALRERFGDDYLRYCESVPRWIPRRSAYQPGTGATQARS
jgi:protein-S-isoprenylcysteine O-methyltransferase Ste14